MQSINFLIEPIKMYIDSSPCYKWIFSSIVGSILMKYPMTNKKRHFYYYKPVINFETNKKVEIVFYY